MVQENSIKILIIAGPTCSGKSDFAIEAAKLYNGAVISADSMQIYKHMDIGTAKPKASEFQGITHYLIDTIDPGEAFSAAEYKAQAEDAINNCAITGRLPIIAGGTGLYIHSLIYPLSFGQAEGNGLIREDLKAECAEFGAQHMHDKLKELDPGSAARLHVNDTRRVIRAIEIALSGGGSMSEKADEIKPSREYLMLITELPREELYTRINYRVDKMFEAGLIEEVKSLKEIYPFGSQAMQAIGYKEFEEYFKGNMGVEEIKELIKKNTRNYAKRQLTWFRKYKDAYRFNPLTRSSEALEYIGRNL